MSDQKQAGRLELEVSYELRIQVSGVSEEKEISRKGAKTQRKEKAMSDEQRVKRRGHLCGLAS